MPLWI